MSTRQLNEDFLNDAATEAIGGHTALEADAFTVQLAQVDESHRQANRALRDTVARMAGLAPYMEPPSALRGAILAATAPKSFKIEDYRRNGDIAPKWLRRSLVASIGFLIFAAWYNAAAKKNIDNLTASNANMVETMKGLKAEHNKLVADYRQLNDALYATQTSFANAILANHDAPHGLVQDTLGNKHVLLQDPATAQFIVLFPDQQLGPNEYVTLSGKGNDGKIHEFKALAVGQPKSGPMNGNSLAYNNPVDAQWKGLRNEQTAPTPVPEMTGFLHQANYFQP